MNQENLNGTINVNNDVTTAQPNVQPVQPMPSVQPQPAPAQPMPSVQPQPAPVQPMPSVQPQPVPVQPESVDVVNNLNKEDAMEEALSHTNQYTPFEVQQEEVNQETNIMGNKKAIVFLIVILVIMGLFVFFLPQISKMFGL